VRTRRTLAAWLYPTLLLGAPPTYAAAALPWVTKHAHVCSGGELARVGQVWTVQITKPFRGNPFPVGGES
jgi:hypothetical protein